MRIPRLTRGWLAGSVTALAATGLSLALTAGPALASPQWNQEWYGNIYGYSDFQALGNPSLAAFGSGLNYALIQIQSAWGNYPNLLCMDVNGNAYDAGTQVWMYDCNGGTNQTWEQDSGADPGTWTFAAGPGSLCLDALDGKDWNGAPLVVNDCNRPSSAWHGSQEWTIGPNSQLQSYSDGVYYHDSLCADVVDPGNADPNPPAQETLVQMWQCAY